ncbi:DMT family transporter [Streptomyces sp. NPDC050560]|uniref:DMT family transporter n=1 Tax=Streptomyces sp. NPDC050560 TaxID=3365630 RepID=UPI0037AFFE2C
MSDLTLSVLLALVSAVAYAAGAVVQERVAADTRGQYAPLRRPSWWAAVVLNGLGGLLHVAALAYGPLSLVQPLGALTIVFALPMAALFVGRRAGATAWRGAVMATVGLAGLLSLTGSADGGSLGDGQRIWVALLSGGTVLALMGGARLLRRSPAMRSVLLATASGIAFGIASVFTKTVALDWSDGPSVGLELPTLLVLAVMAVGGLLLSQAAYRGAGLAAPLATLTVVNPVVAAAVGIALFGESFRYGTTGTALALVSGIVTAGGLVMLTVERAGSEGAGPGERAEAPLPADKAGRGAREAVGGASVPEQARRAGEAAQQPGAGEGEPTSGAAEAAAAPAPKVPVLFKRLPRQKPRPKDAAA